MEQDINEKFNCTESYLEYLWDNFIKSDEDVNKVQNLNSLTKAYNQITRNRPVTFIDSRSLSSIPSRISFYLLQSIFANVNTISNLSTNSTENVTINENNVQEINIIQTKDETSDNEDNICVKRNFLTQLKLKQPNEINHVIQLREFLLSGLGGKLMDAVQIVGVKNVTCSRELTSLFINLFPTAPWKYDNDIEHFDKEIKDMFTFDNLIESYDVNKIYSKANQRLINTVTVLSQNCLKQDLNQRYTCAQFSSIVINLLIGLVHEENNLIVTDENSVTVQCLLFGVDNFFKLQNDTNIFDSKTCKIMRRKLLILIHNCFYNLFMANSDFLDFIDLVDIYKKLIITLQYDLNNSNLENMDISIIQNDIIYGTSFLLYYILNKAYNFIKDYNELFNILLELFQTNNNLICSTINILSNTTAEMDNKITIYIQILQKTICDIMKQENNNNINSSKDKRLEIKMLKKYKVLYNNTANIKKHFKYKDIKICAKFKCVIENFLFNIIKYLTITNQKIILKHFYKNMLCSCNCNLKTLKILLSISKNNEIQDNCLNFIRKYFVRLIIKFNITTKLDNFNLNDFNKEFIYLYKEMLNGINDKKQQLCIGLKHTAKISKFLPTDITEMLLIDVIIPIFLNEKQILIKSNLSETKVDDGTKDVINYCLNVITTFLKNKKLIQLFFIERNINELSDLLLLPYHAKNVCLLITIGIINNKSLGINTVEQQCLSKKLINMLFNSSLLITDLIIDLLLDFQHHNSKMVVKINEYFFEHINYDNEKMINIILKESSPIKSLLHLGNIYWNNIAQLTRSCQYFNDEFIRYFNETYNNNLMFDIVYNIISCFLMTHTNKQYKQHLSTINIPIKNKHLNYSYNFDLIKYNNAINNYIEKLNILNNYNNIDLPDNLLCDKTTNLFYKNNNTINCDFFHICNLKHINKNLYQKEILISSYAYQNNFIEQSDKLFNDYKDEKIFNYLKTDDDATNDIDKTLKQFIYIYDTKKLNMDIVLKTIKYNYQLLNNINMDKIILDTNNLSLFNNVLINLSPTTAKKLNQFVNNSIFRLFFSNNDIKNNITNNHNNKDINIINKSNATIINRNIFNKQQLLSLNSIESKKLLTNIFENLLILLMDVYDYNYNIELVMSTALKELKELIFLHSNDYWSSLENGKAIISSLQSLLKVAETKGTKCLSNSCIIFHKDDEKLQDNNYSSESKDSESEFLSPAPSFDTDIFGSDIEFSDNEDNYGTPDEAYDADAEVPKTKIDDLSWFRKDAETKTTPTHYRAQKGHEGICKIIIEVLIQLSNRCLENPIFWPALLTQLSARLSVIKSSLGESKFLLHGFRPVLESDDNRLKELQKSILELITHINSPEALTTYFGFLTAENPPVDILIPRLVYLAEQSKSNEPCAALEFPVIRHNYMTATCDRLLLEKFRHFQDFHKHYNINSIFTKAATVVPLNWLNFQPWTSTGFTLTSWIHIKSTHVETFTCKHTKTETPSPKSDSNKPATSKSLIEHNLDKMLHLLSIGNDNVVISVYLLKSGKSNKLCINVIKPNAEINEKALSGAISIGFPVENDQDNVMTRSHYSVESFSNEVRIDSHKFDKRDSLDESDIGSISGSPPSSSGILKSTTNALRKSLSSLFAKNLKTNEFYGVKKPIVFKEIDLSNNSWMFIGLSVSTTSQNEIKVSISVNGQEKCQLLLNHLPIFGKEKIDRLTVLGIGHVNDANEDENNNINYQYKLSNVMLFKKSITEKYILDSLMSLGSDLVSINSAQISKLNPLYIYNEMNANKTKMFNLHKDAIKILSDNLLAIYSAHVSDILTGYNNISKPGQSERIGIISQSIKNNLIKHASFTNATILSGGVSNLLFLFAVVVEKSSSIFHQSSVLKLLLKTVYNSKELYTEFKRIGGFDILSGVIRHKKCVKSLELLRCFLDVAFNGSVITMKSGSEELHVIPDACLQIKYPELIIYIIDKYNSCWIGDNNKESKILDALFSIILSVTEHSMYQNRNMEILKHAGLISSLINFCKVNFIDSVQPTYISKKAADTLVNIVNILACSSPTASLLDEIFKLLLLLHRPSDSFITHDRSKFYFLISSTIPNKRGINFSINSSAIGHSMRFKPRKGYVSIRNFPLASKLRRSRSFDISHSEQSNVTEDEHSKNNIAKSSSFSKNEKKIVNLEDIVQFRGSSRNSNNELKNIVSESNESHCPQPSTSKVEDTHIYANVNILKTSSRSTSSRKSSTYLEPSDAVKLSKALLNTHIRRQHENRRRSRRITRRKLRTFSRTDSETDRDDNSFTFNSKYGLFGLNNLGTKIKHEEKNIYHGVTYIQEGFFNLLNIFILILPDTIAEEVLSHFVTVEVLLVMSSHHDVNVRAAILRLLAAITHRLSFNTLTQFSKQKYWHHLGNQISLHPANMNLVEACVQWITGTKFSLENFPENEINVEYKQGLNALIALIPQTLYDKDLAITSFKFVDIFYHKSSDCAHYMIENGLIPSLIRTVIKYFTYQAKITNCKIYDKMCDLLSSIAYKSLITSGTINALWDLLNGITYIEITKSGIIMRGARQTQAIIINSLLKNCINTVTSPISLLSFKLKVSKITFPGCTLSQTEMKARFDLIMDRCVQFVTNAAPIYALTKYEIKLIETVITLVLNGQAKGANIVNWCFSPTRSIDLKVYIIRAIWKHCKSGNLSTYGCDTKLIKTFTKAFIQTSRDSISKEDFDTVTDFCNSLGGAQVTTWNISQALERLEITREASIKEQRPAIDRSVFKYESIIPTCVDVAMKITRDVVELQNVERRLTINQMRSDDERRLYEKWNTLIKRLTDEGAPWHNNKYYPNSWQLDTTEGPGRIRIKTKRCFLGFAASFLHKDYREEPESSPNMILSYLLSSLDRKPNISLTDQLLYSFNVRLLEVDKDIYGELIITESQIVLIPTDNVLYEAIICDISNVTEIWPRRYQHNEIAFEFFMDSGNTHFFIMSSKEDYDALKKFFTDKIVQWFDPLKLSLILQQWKEGQLTNWDYLMALNQLAGRSYHDLMQYPVFPWVLCDYENSMLDIDNSECFRKFERPIAIQSKDNEAHYISNYIYLTNSVIGSSLTQLEPYHYGSHYSNSGTVLHFLVRIPPFTNMFLNYQDNNFDIPDRTFHSLLTTWRLASNDSPTDVKELTPEFFSFPEMFSNTEGFNFGVRQSGERVHHVSLPAWCFDSSRLFTLIHRQAIESDIVRRNIHRWIDLIFGYKQSGQAAIDAINVFHPATYNGFTCSESADAVEKIAFHTMMKTYGQMPRQLFKEPHPAANMSENLLINDRPILPSVKGLRWGICTGSPELSEPIMSSYYQQYDIVFGSIIALKDTNVVYGVPDRCNVMQGIEPDTMNLISWGETDNVIKIKPFFDNGLAFRPLLEVPRVDSVTACGTNYNSTQLWLGHQSGRLCVYQCTSININKYNKNRYLQHSTFSKLSYNSAFRKITMKKFDMDNNTNHMGNNEQYFNNMKWNGPIILTCHHGEITNIKISMEFKIVVTVDINGLAAIWDLNKIQYIRSIAPPAGELEVPITNLIISPTLGDIVTIHSIGKHEELNSFNHIFNNDDSFEVTETNLDDFVKISMNHNGKSLIRLHSINGKYINHVAIEEKIVTACYSYIKEGTGVNIIAAGLENGIVRLWSSWNLDYIRDIRIATLDIIDLSFSTYQHLIILTKQSFIHVWESQGLKGNSPKLPQIVFSNRCSV